VAVIFRLYVMVAGASLTVLLSGPALAKTAPPVPSRVASHAVHHRRADLQYAQSYYDYRSASSVREEFADAPCYGRFDRFGDRRERHDGFVVENLQGDFNGGVGTGADGAMSFTDGYGQVHFFTGNFAPRFGMSPGRRFAPRPGTNFRPGFSRGR
jgi:hypothetical protein